MIGLDFPLKPEWIQVVLKRWEPEQPITRLIERSLAEAMPELSGEKTRRNSLSILLRMFVPTAANSRMTAAQNIWASYSALQSLQTLAPAYLARIIAESEVAQVLSQYITQRYQPGNVISSSGVRGAAVGKFGERKVVMNAASAFLTTLQAFSVLQPASKRGEYIIQPPMPVSPDIFPLLVWAWWQQNPVPQIEPDMFKTLPPYQWLAQDEFAKCWRRYQPDLWSISERLDNQMITVKYPDPLDFEKKMIAVTGV